MDSTAVYTNTLAAITASLSFTTSKSEREACDRYIQQLKETKESLSILAQILSQDHNESIKLLTIIILNDWIKLWWNKLSEAEHLPIRSLIFNILASPMGISSKSIRTKIAVMLTNIAQRQFPQQWPSMIEDFVSIWTSSQPERQEVIIMSLEFIITDCIDSDFNNTLPTIRRQEIVIGLKDKQELILNTTCQCLTVNLNQFVQNAGTEVATHAQQLVEAIAKMLIPLASLIKPEEICVAPHEYSGLLFEMLRLPAVKQNAIEILQTLSQQKFTIEVLSLFLMGFQRTGVLSTLPSEELQEALQFQRAYATTMMNVLSNNISWVFDKKLLNDVAAASCLDAYIQILLEYLKMPSKRLAADIIKDFIKIIKDDLVINMPNMEQYSMIILSEYMKRCKKPSDEELENDEVHQLEFEDSEEWLEFSGTLKSQIKALADVITSRYTLTTMHTLTGFLKSTIAQVQAGQNNSSIAQNKTIVSEFEVFYNIYTPLFQYIMPTSDQAVVDVNRQKDIHTCMVNMVEVIYNWTPMDDLMITEKYRQLQAHAIILNQLPIEYTIKIFDMMFEHIVTYINTNNAAGGSEQNPIDNNKRILSIKVTANIAHFSQSCAERLVQSSYINTLLNQVNSILSAQIIQANNTMQSSLRETLIGLAEHVNDVTLKNKIFTLALSEVIMKLNSNSHNGAYMTVFNNSESLLKSALLHCQDNKFFVDVRSIINTIYLTAKRIKNPALPIELYVNDLTIDLATFQQQFPFAEVWLSCLPAFFKGVQVLHSLWTPSTRQLLYSEWQRQNFADGIEQGDLFSGLYIPSIADTHKMTTGGTANSGNTSGEAGKQTNGQKIHWELRELRIYLYQVLAQACSHKIIYLSPDLSTFLNELSSQLEYMENYQLSIFVRYFLESFVTNALPSAFPIISTFLTSFLSKSLMRINVAWEKSNDIMTGRDFRNQADYQLLGEMLRDEKIFYAYNYYHCSIVRNLGASTVTTEEYETIRDGCVNEVTRSYCDLLTSFSSLRGHLMIVVSSTAANTSAATIAENEMKSTRTASLHKLFFGLSFGSLTTQYIANTISCLCLPDGAICRKILALINHLIELSVTDARLIPVVAKEAFTASLLILLRQEKWSVGLEWELIDILLDIYVLYVLGEKNVNASATLNPQVTTKNSPTKDGWNTNPFNNNKNNNSKGGKTSGSSSSSSDSNAPLKRHPMISDIPLKILMEVRGVTKESIDKLDKQLLTTLQKKKRRALFKDFITDLIQLNGQSASTDNGSLFKQNTSQILDIRNRLLKASKSKKSNVNGDFNVSGLFDDGDL